MQFYNTRQSILLRKIGRRKDEIRALRIADVRPLAGVTVVETPEFLSYADAMALPGQQPIEVGQEWGGGTNAWFRLTVDVPQEWQGREVAAFLEFGGEGCAFINGAPYQGVDGNHQEVLLTGSSTGGESFDIVVDVASQAWHSPHDKSPRRFTRAEIAVRNPEVEKFWFDLEILHLLAETLPEDSPRRGKIIYTLSKAVDAFDYTDTSPDVLKASAQRAAAILEPLLQMPAAPSATDIAVHGHSHIDTAWLWPYRETKRKCARTFSSVMRLMEQYPQYIFTQSQAQLYEFTKENYPELYAEIKQSVADGRWDVNGSMWVEADCNLSSGESLIRQVLVGKNFFLDEFGIETDVLWLPDVFGYAAALPQILQKSGVPYFSTIKIHWSQFNQFPYSTFYWQGIDGSKVLAHFPPSGDYNAYPDPGKLQQQVRGFHEKDRCDWSLMSYGWGDGGGGPDRRHLEFLQRSSDLEGLPRCHQMKVSEFFGKIDGDFEFPVWVGELYLELHRGTYTTQARNKRYNRKSELLYRDAELLASAARAYGFQYPYEELLRQWKRILCNQFHDVIPGSSIRLVYDDTDKMYPEIIGEGERVADDALRVIASQADTSGDGIPIIVFNSLSWQRTSEVVLKGIEMAGRRILGPDGDDVAYTVADDELRFVASVPSMGFAVYRAVQGAPSEAPAAAPEASAKLLENSFYRIELDDSGEITSLVHKATGREVLPPGQKSNAIRLYEDKPLDWDAWDIDYFYDEKWDDIRAVDSMERVDAGPGSSAVQIKRSFGGSRLRQTIRIYDHTPRIDFETWVDWHESRKCLKACFPVDVNSAKARYEIQFGNVERPTHGNTSWDFAKFEVCAHKWADLSEEGFGVSLMNDCKYGHHTDGNEMRLTLLRSPKEPDPTADQGEHLFTYSLMPHSGDYIEAETVRRAYELNIGLRAAVVEASVGPLGTVASLFSVDAPNVIIETVKRAEKEDATIIRLYECHNQRARATVSIGNAYSKVSECDLMERDLEEVTLSGGSFPVDLRPFDIRTFKLK